MLDLPLHNMHSMRAIVYSWDRAHLPGPAASQRGGLQQMSIMLPTEPQLQRGKRRLPALLCELLSGCLGGPGGLAGRRG